MANIPRSGVTFCALFEYDVRLDQVIEYLGLKPLDEDAERRIRDQLGRVIAKRRDPHTGVKAGELAKRLSRLTNNLEKNDELLSSLEPGIHNVENIQGACWLAQALTILPEIDGLDQAHAYILEFRDRTRIITKASHKTCRKLDLENLAADSGLIESLSGLPEIGNEKAARRFILDFSDRVKKVKAAALSAASALDSINGGKGGRPRYDWLDGYVAVIAEICADNGIEVKPVDSRKLDQPAGRFFEVAYAFEWLLAPKMRSPTAHALARRMNRSLKRMSA